MANVKNTLDDVQCYVGNTQELLQDLEGEVFEDDGTVIKFNIEKGGVLAQVLWNQLRETILECEGKQLVVQYPEGFAGAALQLIFQLANFRLESPVVIDSPDLVPDHIKEQIKNEDNTN